MSIKDYMKTAQNLTNAYAKDIKVTKSNASSFISRGSASSKKSSSSVKNKLPSSSGTVAKLSFVPTLMTTAATKTQNWIQNFASNSQQSYLNWLLDMKTKHKDFVIAATKVDTKADLAHTTVWEKLGLDTKATGEDTYQNLLKDVVYRENYITQKEIYDTQTQQANSGGYVIPTDVESSSSNKNWLYLGLGALALILFTSKGKR